MECKELVLLDKVEQAIIQAKSIDEIKNIMDKAEVIRLYAKKAQKGLVIQNRAAEIKLLAERQAGVWLAKDGPKQGPKKSHDATFSLKSIGINKSESSRWQAVASLPEKEFKKHVAEVKESNKELTTVGVLKLARELFNNERDKAFKPKDLPDGKFNVIYADPPWKYDNSGFGMSANNKYMTMEIEKLGEMNVASLSAENSVCFMWATNPFLKEAIWLLEKWGFEYKTNFVWVKQNHTAGFYVYGKHELLLIGVKGSMLPKGEMQVSVIEGSNKVHSKKPDCVYGIIEKMYPNSKYVELFARKVHSDKWEAWGNEIS